MSRSRVRVASLQFCVLFITPFFLSLSPFSLYPAFLSSFRCPPTKFRTYATPSRVLLSWTSTFPPPQSSYSSTSPPSPLHNIHQTQAKADQPKIRQIAPFYSLGEVVSNPSKERISPQNSSVHTRRKQRRRDRNAHQRGRISPRNRESHADSRRQRD